MNQKNVVFFLSKVENNKYPEAETWHPESITGRSYIVGYMRISDDPLAQPHGGNLGPICPPPPIPPLFKLNFTRILWFSWDLGRYLRFLRTQFL